MESKTIRFAVKDNTTMYKLELAKSLLFFTEFDFTYFWEQCIDAGKNARRSGRLPPNQIANAKNLIAKLHPYIEATIASDFSEIVTDCIIEYICQSDRITLDELWTRCISPKNPYESAIFKRVSEFKTNKASNQWVNLMRLQEYARNKISFIYDPDETGAVFSKDIIRTRRIYFDLSWSVSANELGLPCKQLPSVKFCNPASLPNATFVVSKVSRAIYRRFADDFDSAESVKYPETGDYTFVRDKLALDAYSYVKGMTRPSDIDMKFAIEAIEETPDEIFLVDGFKALIDLEFDLMFKTNVSIRKCESCSRYFIATGRGTFCDRINSSGKTCSEQYEDIFGYPPESIYAEEEKSAPAVMETAVPDNENDVNADVSDEVLESLEQADDDKSEVAAVAAEAAPVPVTSAAPVPAPAEPARIISEEELAAPWRFVPPPNKGVPVPKELEKHGQRLYNALYKRLGKGMEENEFKEWSQYLSNMKRNVKTGDGTIEQLEEFLEYSDRLVEAVKIAGKTNQTISPSYKKDEFNDDHLERLSAEGNVPQSVGGAGGVVKEDKNSVPIKPIKSESGNKTYDESQIKPFAPKAFASIEEAERSEDSDVFFDPIAAAKKKEQGKEKQPVEVKEPKWERMTREEAYAREAEDLAFDGWEDEDDESDIII